MLRTRTRTLLLAAATATLAVTAAACGDDRPAAGRATTPTAPRAPTIDAAHLEAQLTPYIESHGRVYGDAARFSGYVLVAQHDQPVYARAFGFADRAKRTPVTADTSFRIGSITKPFTAVAIHLLAADGKLALDDTVGELLPGYTGPGARVTVEQLLTHTSGIPSYTSDPDVMSTRDRARTRDELIATFRDKPLEFEPGARFAYSNSGYVLLGAIIERASGLPYADFVRARIVEPAGLTHTVVGDAEGAADRAEGYVPDGDALVPAPPIHMSIPDAAGAIRSTANDLVRFHRALSDDRLLDATARARMYTPAHGGYAHGWVVGELDGRPTIGHDGGIDGFTSGYVRVPDLDLVVVVLSNNMGVDAGAIARAATMAAVGGTLEPVDERAAVTLDDAAAARLAGTYTLTDASRDAAAKLGLPAEAIDGIATITIGRDGDRIVVTPAGQPAFPVEATGPSSLRAREIDVTIELTLPADGPATGLRITQGPVTLEYARAP